MADDVIAVMAGDESDSPPESAESAVPRETPALRGEGVEIALTRYFWEFETAVPGGIVVDPDRARVGPCTVIPLGVDAEGRESELAFHKGVVGALDTEQKALFCAEREIEQPSPAELEQIRRFKAASEACAAAAPPGSRESLTERISCLSAELSRHEESASE